MCDGRSGSYCTPCNAVLLLLVLPAERTREQLTSYGGNRRRGGQMCVTSEDCGNNNDHLIYSFEIFV